MSTAAPSHRESRTLDFLSGGSTSAASAAPLGAYFENIVPRRPWYYRNRRRWRLSFRAYRTFKRILDVLCSLAAMPLILPVIAICAVAIKIESRGPAIFRQKRTGKGGRRFEMFKLRTMLPNADALKAQYAHLNELSYPDFKIRNDPRVTRVGRFLRKTSLDELPEFVNVLRGDMSLVGPRPTSFHADTYSLWHTARLEIEPGITGLWQVCGRGSLSFDERLRLDIAYARYRCLSLDLEILLRTVGAVISARGAN